MRNLRESFRGFVSVFKVRKRRGRGQMTKKKIICPVCGKPALDIHKYKDGSGMVIHELKKGLFGFMEVTKDCTIRSKGK